MCRWWPTGCREMCSSICRLSSALLLSVNPLGPFVGVSVLRCALRRFRNRRICHDIHNRKHSKKCDRFAVCWCRSSQLSAEWQQLGVVWDCICVVGSVVSLCDLSKLSEWAQLPFSPVLQDISAPELRDASAKTLSCFHESSQSVCVYVCVLPAGSISMRWSCLCRKSLMALCLLRHTWCRNSSSARRLSASSCFRLRFSLIFTWQTQVSWGHGF